MEGTLATILLFGGNFAPLGWRYCDGSLLAISENEALFSLLGTTYGGDGMSTFGLPDLRGRIPVGAGTGAGLSPVSLGEMAGTESVTLTTAQMPGHVHTLGGSLGITSATADGSNNPTRSLATPTQNIYAPVTQATGEQLGGVTVNIGIQGGSQPVSIIQSYQAINYVICVEGIYPSRN